jgi:hypothetical protein
MVSAMPVWNKAARGNFGGEEQARVPPFDAIELELAALWEAPAETPPGDSGP